MADPKHIQWLLEGVEKWNARRINTPFTPDLSGADLRRKNLTGANLSFAHIEGADLSHVRLEGKESNLREARLEGARLDNSRLKGANLALANLSNAKLYKADLRGANLTNARLEGAYMNFAKLEEANLDSARLNNAKLEHATVDRANLQYARLTGADLQNVKLWRNELYPKEASPKQYPEHQLPVEVIETIDGLTDKVRKLEELYRSHSEEVRFYFRGEPNTAWELMPYVARGDSYDPEGEMLVELISRRPEEFSKSNSALAQWVLAQHHGLKTRFLDITRNPLVALFAACGGIEGKYNKWEGKSGRLHIFVVPRSIIKPFNSNTISIIANFAKLSRYEQYLLLGKEGASLDSFDETLYSEPLLYPEAMERLYQLIRQEKPSFAERINPRDFYKVFLVEPQQSAERIRAQSGAFLVSAFHKRFGRQDVRLWNNQIPIYANYRVTIPSDRKEAILKYLALLNITQETMFPGLDSSAAAITRHYSGGG